MEWLKDLFRKITTFKSLHFVSSATGKEVNEPAVPKSVYAASIFINCMALALPLTILQVYDRVLPNDAKDTLFFLIAGLISVVMIDSLLKFLRSYVIGWTGAAYTHVASLEAFRRLMNAPSHEFERTSVSSYLNRLNALSSTGDFLGGQSRVIGIDLPFVPMFGLIMYLVGGPIVLVPIILFCVFAALAVYRSRKIRKVVEERDKHDNRKYDFVIETLSGMHTIKSMAMEPQIMRRFERLQHQVGELSYQSIILTGAAQSFGTLYASLSTIVLVVYGAHLAIAGQLTIGGLACCMLLSSQIIQPLLRSISMWSEVQTMRYRREEAAHLFEMPPVTDKIVPLTNLSGRIRLSNLSFQYKDDAKPLMRGINVDIAPGEIIGLKGGDGSGRSTLLRMICGDLKPTEGSIFIDDVDLSGPDAERVYPRIGYVDQTPFAFRGTILENLTMFGGTSPLKAREAAELIDLETEIKRYPTGFDTPLGDGTAHDIPASAAQRINIARTLARQPAILLLDEANTAFDHRGEEAFVAALHKLRGTMTVIIATHRPSLMRLADRCFEFKRGKLLPYDPSAPRTEKSKRLPPSARRARKVAS